MRLRSSKTNNQTNDINIEQKVKRLEQTIVEHEQEIIRNKEPEGVLENITNLLENPNKRPIFEEELETAGYLEEFSWEDTKNDYNRSNKKQEFIKNLESWTLKKPATVAKERACTINKVNLKRGAYFLLGNYLINESSKEVQYLKFPGPVYQRIANIIEIIGKHFLLLPIPTNYFTGRHSQKRKVVSFTNWLQYEHDGENSDDNLDSDLEL
ncbi:hypothetical protein F8M41_023890 [Gigaspora margarita]|uniref:Uncharacterized protein n=1 Tax=Gigaspora margarita TaxID=4874 RepID=A0A8H4ACN1_GIGMA|nr:hypothetical protein F8M41_023890 [Gigaspora margarita]